MFFKKHKQAQVLAEALQLEQFAQERAQWLQRQLSAEALAKDQVSRLERSEQVLETLRRQLDQARQRE